jgi:hypothetical protein
LVYPLHYSSSYPIPLLKIISVGFNVPYSYMYRKYNLSLTKALKIYDGEKTASSTKSAGETG